VLNDVIPGMPRSAVVLGLFVVIIAINALGLEPPRTLQLAMTVLLVLATLLVGASALWMQPTMTSPAPAMTLPAPSLMDFTAAVGTAIFLFIGFEWVTPLGRSPKAYERLIPLSMLLAIGCLIAVYGVFAAGLDHQLGRDLLADNPIPQITLGGALYGPAGRYALAMVAVLAMLTSFNAGLMGASRLIYGLAREGVAPAWAARVSLRTGAPIAAVAAVGALSFALALIVIETNAYRLTGVTIAAIECLVYAALMLAVLRLRRTRAQAPRPFRTPVPHAAQWVIAAAFPLLAIGALISLPEAGLWPIALFGVLAIGAASAALLSVNRIARRIPFSTKQGANP